MPAQAVQVISQLNNVGTRMQYDPDNHQLYVDGQAAVCRSDVTKLPAMEQAAFVTYFDADFDSALRLCNLRPALNVLV